MCWSRAQPPGPERGVRHTCNTDQVRAGGGHHVQIQRGLLRPAGVHRRQGGAAGLVELGETACAAGRQTVLAAVGGQVSRGGGRVVGVDDGDGDATTRRGGGQRVGSLQVRRSVSAGNRCGRRQRAADIQIDDGVTRRPTFGRNTADPRVSVTFQTRRTCTAGASRRARRGRPCRSSDGGGVDG